MTFIDMVAPKGDEMQVLAKFKKILYIGFRATLNFRKFKVALNPMNRLQVHFVVFLCNMPITRNESFIVGPHLVQGNS